jgi:hypothetical protein
MSSEQFCRMLLASSAFALLIGCAAPTDVDSLSGARLGAAVRGAGFPCTGVISSDEAGSNGAMIWRVSCENAAVYTANVQDGRICATPIAYIDGLVPGVPPISIDGNVVSPTESCISLGDI